MSLLAHEKNVIETFLPGLKTKLATIPMLELESPCNIGLKLFKEANGPGLLIPKVHGGKEANALEAIQIQQVIASYSPSLAIATTMHHFSVATIVEMSLKMSGLEGILLTAIAQQNLLVASGFAEGRTDMSILTPTMQAKRVEDGLLVSGVKKPCSLSVSMDLLTASVTIEGAQNGEFSVVLIPAKTNGVKRESFWGNAVLAGAESDAVILTDVLVPKNLVFHAGDANKLDDVQISGFLWFELLITASYIGMLCRLTELALLSKRGSIGDKARLGIELEGAKITLEGIARSMNVNKRDSDELARMLYARYHIEQVILRASALALELLGGMSFITSSDANYLFMAAHALSFHPPSRASMYEALVNHLMGGSLVMR